MHDFTYYNPTKIEFGKNKEDNIGHYLQEAGIQKVLLTYGMQSIKKNGLYERIISSLEKSNIEYIELPGVVSNPLLSKVREGIALAKAEDVEAILGVGGGSVADNAKAIAAGALYSEDVWDFFTKKAEISKALPVFTVMTLAASASEMNGNSVITNDATQQKYSIGSVHVNPTLSIINPELMMSVTPEYLAYSAVDVIAHSIEVYLTASSHPTYNSMFVESIIKSIMHNTEILLRDPSNYEARGEFAWVAIQALNGLAPAGTQGGSFPNHLIEHSLSALYNVAHGAGLAVVIPAWMQWYHTKNPKQFERFAQEIFGVNTALEGIQKLTDWFEKIGAPTTLKDINIPREAIFKIAENASETAKIWGMQDLYTQENITQILQKA
jgi:NADP-dependent alcohol dehydrogenase